MNTKRNKPTTERHADPTKFDDRLFNDVTEDDSDMFIHPDDAEAMALAELNTYPKSSVLANTATLVATVTRINRILREHRDKHNTPEHTGSPTSFAQQLKNTSALQGLEEALETALIAHRRTPGEATRNAYFHLELSHRSMNSIIKRTGSLTLEKLLPPIPDAEHAGTITESMRLCAHAASQHLHNTRELMRAIPAPEQWGNATPQEANLFIDQLDAERMRLEALLHGYSFLQDPPENPREFEAALKTLITTTTVTPITRAGEPGGN